MFQMTYLQHGDRVLKPINKWGSHEVLGSYFEGNMSAVLPEDCAGALSGARLIFFCYGLSSDGLELREEFTCIHIQRASVVQDGHVTVRGPSVTVPLEDFLVQVTQGR